MLSRTGILALGEMAVTVAGATACAQPFFMGIGTLDGSASGSNAYGISPDGAVVVGHNFWNLYTEVTCWTAEGGTCPVTPGRASRTYGVINWNGTAIGGHFPGEGTTEAFRWTPTTGAVSLGDLDGGEFRSTARGVGIRGGIIVGSSSSERSGPDTVEAYRWTAETGMVAMGDLPGGEFASGAGAVSADERVILGTGYSEIGREPFLWTAETGMVGLGKLPAGTDAAAEAISADGTVVVANGFDDGRERSFRWTEQTGWVALEPVDPNLQYQRARAISWDGNVIVGETGLRTGQFGAFYWTPETGTRWLTDVLTEHGVEVPEGWQPDWARAVSADGRTIAGGGLNPEGHSEGWIAYLGPACRADYNKDGSVSPDDVIAYLGAWAQRSIFADWDYDGLINTRDVIAFLAEWVAKPGC